MWPGWAPVLELEVGGLRSSEQEDIVGIEPSNMIFMLRAFQELPPDAIALTYGKLDVNNIALEFATSVFQKHGRKFVNFDGVAGHELITEQSYFRNFGFSAIHHLDIESGEGAEICFDLSETYAEHHLYERYDAVFDFGTLEHVFDVRAALENTVKFLKVGGRVYHAVPANGLPEHGFYQMSPTLFWDYYQENGLVIHFVLTLHAEYAGAPNAIVRVYDPTVFRSVKRIEIEYVNSVGTYVCAERSLGSTWNKKPIQHNIRMYYDHFRRLKAAATGEEVVDMST